MEANTFDAVRSAALPATFKRDLLNLAWQKTGPETLLSVGKGVRNVSYDPVWAAALRSATPATLIDKWLRHEKFGHSRNRLRIEQVRAHCASFHRYTVEGGVPTPPENLLICGLFIALLEEIGCAGVQCDMALNDGTLQRIYGGGRFCVPNDPEALVTTHWTIAWRVFSPKTENLITQATLPEIGLPLACDEKLKVSIDNVARLVLRDVSHQWKVGELAREAGMSTRTLQRRLHKAGLSFSRLVRLARVHEACCLLRNTDTPTTAIGFCAGFSDSAHFSRDFRASVGMTPSDYRAAFRD